MFRRPHDADDISALVLIFKSSDEFETSSDESIHENDNAAQPVIPKKPSYRRSDIMSYFTCVSEGKCWIRNDLYVNIDLPNEKTKEQVEYDSQDRKWHLDSFHYDGPIPIE